MCGGAIPALVLLLSAIPAQVGGEVGISPWSQWKPGDSFKFTVEVYSPVLTTADDKRCQDPFRDVMLGCSINKGS